MPYTRKQCKLFGYKASKGQDVPDDWKKHCASGKSKKKSKATKNRRKK